MTQDLYYVDSGYLTPDSGYYVYIADAEAAVSSAATMAVTAGVIKDCVSTIVCQTTVAAVISHIHGADLVAFSNAAIATQINVIRTTNVALTSVFSAAIDGSRGIYVSAQADAVVSISIANSRVRFTEAAHTAAFSLACDATKILGDTISEADATLFNTVSLSASITKFANANVDAINQFTQTVSADKFANSAAALVSVSVAIINVVKQSTANINLSSQFTQTTDFSRTRNFVSVNTSAFTPTLAASVLKNSFAVLEATASLTVLSTSVKNAQVIITSAFAPSITAFVDTAFWRNLYYAPSQDPDLADSTIQYVDPWAFTDSSNNLISFTNVRYRTSFGVEKYSLEIIKYDTYGNIIWRKRLSTSDYSVLGGTYLSSKGPNDSIFVANGDYLFKFDADGNILWQKGYVTAFIDINPVVDSEGNVYTITGVSSQTYIRVVKFNGATGSIISQTRINTVASSPNVHSAVIDHNDNLIITWNSSQTNDTYLAKINVSSLTVVWAKQSDSDGVGLSNIIRSVSVDLNNNIYFIYYEYISSTTNRVGFAKYNSSGVFQWYKYLSFPYQTATAGYPTSLFYDEVTDRVYARINSTTQFSHGIAAYDTNGNNLWQNLTGYTSGYHSDFVPSFVDTLGTGLYGIVNRRATNSATTSYRIGIAKVPVTGGGTASTGDTFFYSPTTATTFTTTTNETTAGFFNFTPTFASDTSLSTRSNITPIVRTSVVSLFDKVAITPGSYLYTALATFNSVSTIIANVGMIKGSSASLVSSANVSVIAGKTHSAVANLSAVASMSVIAVKNSEIFLTAFTNASQTTVITRVRSASSTQASEFTQTAVASRTRAVESTQSSLFSQTALINKTVNPPIATEAIFSELVAVARTGAGFVQLDSVSTMSVSVVKTATTTVAVASQFAQTTNAVKSIAANASINANAAVDTNNTRIRNSVIACNFSSELTAQVGEIVQLAASLTAVSNFSCDTSGIKLFSAAISSQASVSANIIRVRSGSSDLACQINLTANAGTVKTAAIATDAIFSELVAVAKTGAGFIQLDSQSTLTAVINKTASATVNLLSEFAEIVQINKQAGVSANLNLAFTQSTETNNSKLVGITSALSLQASVTANAGTVKTSEISTTSIFSELAAIALTGQGFITAEVVASQTTVAIKTARAQANITATASLSITAVRTRRAAAVFDTSVFKQITNVGKIHNAVCGTIPFVGLPVPIWFVVATLTANADRLRVVSAGANINASASLTCQPVKSVTAISLEASSGTLTANLNIIHSGRANLSALAFEIAVGQKVKAFQINIASTSTVSAKIGGTFGFRSTMQGFAAEVAVIDVIHIDAKLTWMIFAEDRAYSIQSENRTYSIVEEDRDYLIVQEDREYAVTRELLTTELQGV